MSTENAFTFTRANLGQAEDKDAFIRLSRDYFRWMDGEIAQHCGFSIPDIVKTELDNYVLHTVEVGCRLKPDAGGIYFIRDEAGRPVAMGGLRRLPDATAEIVRIYTPPESRGKGLGSRMVGDLIDVSRKLGYGTLRLDTAVFMTSAQRIYEAAGFKRRAPYPGAEPPAQLQPYWLYLERAL